MENKTSCFRVGEVFDKKEQNEAIFRVTSLLCNLIVVAVTLIYISIKTLKLYAKKMYCV